MTRMRRRNMLSTRQPDSFAACVNVQYAAAFLLKIPNTGFLNLSQQAQTVLMTYSSVDERSVPAQNHRYVSLGNHYRENLQTYA